MLEVDELHAFYGKSHVLQGVTFKVGPGEIVSLFGRNGVGRSTTLKAVMGQVAARGSVRFKGEELLGHKPHQIACRGLGFVPEDRAIFGDLNQQGSLSGPHCDSSQDGRGGIAYICMLRPAAPGRGPIRTACGTRPLRDVLSQLPGHLIPRTAMVRPVPLPGKSR